MTTKTSYTVLKNSESKNRVWIYWFRNLPEVIPGYWNIETDGIENKTAQTWAANANEWLRAMQSLGCTYEQMIDAIVRVMGNQGFKVEEENLNNEWAPSLIATLA